MGQITDFIVKANKANHDKYNLEGRPLQEAILALGSPWILVSSESGKTELLRPGTGSVTLHTDQDGTVTKAVFSTINA